MSLSANGKKVYDLLNDTMYIVAPNQRKYVWTNNNWQELVDDIQLVYSENTTNHFIGSVVLKRENINDGIRNHYSIIDGQQRISTLTIMLCAIGLLFAENENQDYFYGLNKALFVTDNRNQPHPIVSENANKSIAKLVVALFDNAKKHFDKGEELLGAESLLSRSSVAQPIRNGFLFFYNWFKNRVQNDMELLARYRAIIEDIRYIDIVAEEDEDAYTIFEILNARGQALTDFELLRNHLLRYSSVNEKEATKAKLNELEELLGSDTESFLKHYVIHKYGRKTDKNENRPYKIIAQAEKENSKLALLDDLVLKASYYRKMTHYGDCSPLEMKVFSFFKPRRQQQFRPLVMGMMHQKELQNLSQNEYDRYLEFLYEFFICYHVIGKQTSNKIEDIVYGYSEKIETQFNEQLLRRFRKSMLDRMPNRTYFYNSVKNIRYSNCYKAFADSKTRENVRAIFEIIEREFGYQGDFSSFNIEHCMPDSQSVENAHIGNLMLLEETINRDRCKDKPLNLKISHYQDSELKLPRKMAEENPEGKSFDFEQRSEWIAETLYSYITTIRDVDVLTAL